MISSQLLIFDLYWPYSLKEMEQFETEGHIIRRTEYGLHVYVKPGVPHIDQFDELTVLMLTFDQKFPLLVDPRDATALSKKQRIHATKEMEKFASAVAMINNNLFVPLIFRLVQKFNKPSFPIKIFKREKDAVTWLKTFELIEA